MDRAGVFDHRFGQGDGFRAAAGRQPANLRLHVLGDFAEEGSVQLRAILPNRRSCADDCFRGHAGSVGGNGDDAARRSSLRPTRRHVDDDRHAAGAEGLHNFLGDVDCPAWGIQLDDDYLVGRGCGFGFGGADAAREIFGHGRGDGAFHLQQQDAAAVLRSSLAKPQQQKQEQNCDEKMFTHLLSLWAAAAGRR